MDAQEFREFGYAAIDFVAEYLESVRERWVKKPCSKCEWNEIEKQVKERWDDDRERIKIGVKQYNKFRPN